MKTKINLLLFILIVLFSACDDTQRMGIQDVESETMVLEAATAFGIFSKIQDDASTVVINAAESLKSAETAAPEYPHISIVPFNLTDWPKTITIDYGPENYLGIDGKYRRGVMIITASNFGHVENASWEITFDDFYHNNHKVEGTQTITYNGLNASDNPEYSCSIVNGIITSPENKVFYFEQETTREWINGDDTHFVLTGNTDDLCDDEYLISGTHSGTSSDGISYTMSAVDDPLHINVCCKWVMDGTLVISVADNNVNCKIRYRTGAETGDMCNNQAIISVFGVEYPVTLD